MYLFKVEPALFEPLKVLNGSNVEPDQHVEDVPLVHVNSDQGLELDTFHFLQILQKKRFQISWCVLLYTTWFSKNDLLLGI